MSEFKAGEVVVVKKTKEKVRVVDVRKTSTISGVHIDYWCEYVSSGKGSARFAPSELSRG